MTSMHRRSLSSRANAGHDRTHSSLELRGQLNAKGPGGVPYISRLCRSIGINGAKQHQVRTNLNFVAFVQPPLAPSRLEFKRDERASIPDNLLEQVVRLSAKAEARVPKHNGRGDPGVGSDYGRRFTKAGPESCGATAAP